MKKHYLAVFLFAIVACNEPVEDKTKNKDLLSTDMVNNPNSASGLDSTAAGKLPTIDFEDTIHNFGNIKAGEIVTHDFEFKNNGSSPLIISGTNVACGCTVPDYPHEPIAPGGTGILTVKFNSEGKSGHQEKSVIVQTNTLKGTHMLYIKADIAGK